MFCEKCGKEIPENETSCPFCGVEETAQEAEEIVMDEPVFDVEELGVPVSMVVRRKRGLSRVIIGIVALVLMAAVLVVSFLNPVLVIGNWKMNQTMPTGTGTDFEIESTMSFTNNGKLTLTDKLLNWKDVGYPEDQSSFSNEFQYSVVKNDLNLVPVPAEGEEAGEQQVVTMKCSVTPKQFSYWQGNSIPREVYDYQRDGLFYPSMILWMVSGVLLIVGVLLLAIPGKKHVITTFEEDLNNLEEPEEVEEAEDLDEFLEDIYEEIAAEDEIPEEAAEEETKETEETAMEESSEVTE